MGSANMAIGATVSGIIASYVYNGGKSKLRKEGWRYFIFLTIPFAKFLSFSHIDTWNVDLLYAVSTKNCYNELQ